MIRHAHVRQEGVRRVAMRRLEEAQRGHGLRCEGDRRLRSEIGALNPIGDFGLATFGFACYLQSGLFVSLASYLSDKGNEAYAL